MDLREGKSNTINANKGQKKESRSFRHLKGHLPQGCAKIVLTLVVHTFPVLQRSSGQTKKSLFLNAALLCASSLSCTRTDSDHRVRNANATGACEESCKITRGDLTIMGRGNGGKSEAFHRGINLAMAAR